MGTVVSVKNTGTNRTFIIESPLSSGFHIDQSVSHNGVCLTVTETLQNTHSVTAVLETLNRTNLGTWQPGTCVNIEQCVQAQSFLDGHIVQGHVDTTAICTNRIDLNGSHQFYFELSNPLPHLLIDKGSVAINGVSLTVIEPTDTGFSVAIIPFTLDHTNFGDLHAGDTVNIEYDVIGKYVARIAHYKS
jgi:riboflavin synthase